MNHFTSALRFPLALTVVALLAIAPRLAAADSAPAATAKVEVPIITTDVAVQKQLVELDQVLDAHPGFDQILSGNIDQLEEEAFRKSHPEVAALLKQKPEVINALKAERHFLIHRYVVRRARGPVLRKDLIALDKFLIAHPEIRNALDKDPTQIVQGKFLTDHSSLGEFFTQHPSLSTALLEKPVAPATKSKG